LIIRQVIPILACITLIYSCSTRQKTSDQAENEDALELNESQKETSRFIVSFYSPGNGIDHEMKSKYQSFLTENYSTISYNTAKWGREGEVDLCFDLAEWSEKDQIHFINESKDLLSSSDKVNFYENKACRV
jgi:hypothetical protein